MALRTVFCSRGFQCSILILIWFGLIESPLQRLFCLFGPATTRITSSTLDFRLEASDDTVNFVVRRFCIALWYNDPDDSLTNLSAKVTDFLQMWRCKCGCQPQETQKKQEAWITLISSAAATTTATLYATSIPPFTTITSNSILQPRAENGTVSITAIPNDIAERQGKAHAPDVPAFTYLETLSADRNPRQNLS